MTFDPLVEERVADGVVVPRDPVSGNPFIVPRGEEASVKYDRASSLADYLAKDIFGIKKWEMRHLAIGLGRRPDLAALAGVETYNTGLNRVHRPTTAEENRDSGKRVDLLIERALDHVGLHEKADAGTVVHTATEPGWVEGEGVVPDEWKWMLEAYHELTAGLVTVATEVFVANDATKTAGTFDHAYMVEDQELARQLSEVLGHDLTGTMIGDKKTGKNVHVGDFEVQLGGTYANGDVYLGPPIDGEHQRLTLEEYFGGPVNRKTGLIVHVSTTGAPKPRILPIDLERGFRLGKMAVAVRDARNELDKIGMPKKLDHGKLATAVLDRSLDRLFSENGPATMTADQLRAAGMALHTRFKAVWKQTHTDQMKEALS